jgi:hypothetical protein
MNALRWTNIWKIGFGLALLFSLPTCRPTIATPSTTPTENTYGLSQDSIKTLNSLEKVDDYPLYVMHFVGEYDSPVTANLPDNTTFACSLFAALGNEDNLLYGRNFDWAYAPALLLYTDPPDGYASVSMVNLAYFNLNPDTYQDLIKMAIPERESLLNTPFFPLDGMNEYGLSIGIAAVYESVAGYDSSKPTIGSLVIIREVLDHARTVDEAVAIFSQYNIDFTGGPPVHYLIADTDGQAVLMEFIAGQMVVLPNEHAWHLATNHLIGNGIRGGGGSGWRYDIVEENLASRDGILTPEDAMKLLKDVSQMNTATQWSIVYNFTTGNINVALGRNYEDVHTFQLELVTR